MIPEIRTAALIVVLSLGSAASSDRAVAQVFPPGADAFVASANALAKSAAERVDLGRSTARLNQIRLSLTQKLISAGGGDTIRLSDLDEVRLLCAVQRTQ